MFKQIIDNLPPDPQGVLITLVVAIGIAVGSLTALLGALHSRVTISLMMLSLGAVLGYCVPGWLDLNVNPSVTITMGAVALGLLGFWLHRLCVACALGVMVAGVSLFILHDQIQPIDTHVERGTVVHVSSSIWDDATNTWHTAPEKFRTLAPWVALGAFVVSGLLAMLLPKFGMAAFYSLGGTMLTLFCILLAHESDKIHWLDSTKTGPMTVAALGLAMLLVGFMTQMALLHRPGAGSGKKKDAEEVAA